MIPGVRWNSAVAGKVKRVANDTRSSVWQGHGGDDGETTTNPDCGGDGRRIETVWENRDFRGSGVFSSESSPVYHPLRTDRDAARARDLRS